MKTAAIALLLVLTSSTCYAVEKPKTTKLQVLERVAVYATAEFDAASTYHAIHACPAGYVCRESNPVMRPLAGSPAIFPVMAGSAWAVDYRLPVEEGLPKPPQARQSHPVDFDWRPSRCGSQQHEIDLARVCLPCRRPVLLKQEKHAQARTRMLL